MRVSWEVFLPANPEILLPGDRSVPAGALSLAEIDRIEQRLTRLATTLDSAFVIPLTGIRFGLDAVLGLVPALGDLVGAGLSGYLILEARRLARHPPPWREWPGTSRLTRCSARCRCWQRVRHLLQGQQAQHRDPARVSERTAQPPCTGGRDARHTRVFPMRTLVLIVAALVLGIWSLFAWAVYSLLGFAGGLAESNAEILPIPPELIAWTVALLGGMGGLAVWIVWGLGAAIIAILTMIPLTLLRGRRDDRMPRQAGAAPHRAHHPAGEVSNVADHRSADEIVAGVLGRGPRGRRG
jgi:hypothetical protein